MEVAEVGFVTEAIMAKAKSSKMALVSFYPGQFLQTQVFEGDQLQIPRRMLLFPLEELRS